MSAVGGRSHGLVSTERTGSDVARTRRSLNGIELHHLRVFLAAAEQGSFRRAAAALGVRESSGSRRIRDLENRLGRTLFLRSRSGVRLTITGRCFLPTVQKVIADLNESAALIASLPQAGQQHSGGGDISIETVHYPWSGGVSCEADETHSAPISGTGEGTAMRRLVEAAEMLIDRILLLSGDSNRPEARSSYRDTVFRAEEEGWTP